jgi:hypothetical protein
LDVTPRCDPDPWRPVLTLFETQVIEGTT